MKVKIDGKERNLQSRKFCLICSPFGKHDTRSDKNSSRGCRSYQNLTPEKKRAHIQNVQKQGTDRKIKLVTMFGSKCKYCGYSKLLNALSFHHLDRKTKLFGLDKNNLRCKSWKSITIEAAKCELVCIRCHAEIEAGLNPSMI